MNNQYSSAIFPPDKWVGDNWSLSIFYNQNENFDNLERKIDEINFTYSDANSENQKFVDLVMTDNILEVTESLNPNFQDNNCNEFPEKQFKLDINDDDLFISCVKDEQGRSHIKKAYAMNDISGNYRYEEYIVMNKEELINASPTRGPVSIYTDIISKVRRELLSEEIVMTLNDIIYNIEQLSNQNLNMLYEFGLLDHYKNQLDKLEFEEKNKHVR